MENTIARSKPCRQKPVEHKETVVIDEADKKNCIVAAERFFSWFKVLEIMNECGAYKEKGVPMSVIRMYFQTKTHSFHESFSKNTVYRFLGNARKNWQLFLPGLARAVTCDVRKRASPSAEVRSLYACAILQEVALMK